MRHSHRIWWLLLVSGALACVLVAGDRWASVAGRAGADRNAALLARAHLGLLTSELQKFRLLPLVLAEYPDIVGALSGGGPAAVHRANETLALLAERTDAAVLYAIDAHGRAVAASNWDRPTSFVGQDYTFRRYFNEAMVRGGSELFALGTVSGRPGLYLARRIDVRGRALGVIVVKVEFGQLEAAWAQSPGATIVTDARGVILITSRADWRFRPVRPLDPSVLGSIRASRQFGAAPPSVPPFRLDGIDATVGRVARPTRFRVAADAAPLAGSRLLHLAPLAPPLAAARSQALIWELGLLLLVVIGGGFGVRDVERRRLQARARNALESEVIRRTAELREANARLVIESEERGEADRRFRAAREELAQANRLGSLGQITAGVAHEINQPLAAIRTYAESGKTLLNRGESGRADDNFGRIVALTERIGTITGELRAFSRRRTPAPGSPTLGSAIDGTMLLIGDRARGIVDDRVPPEVRALRVGGDRIRLEQILVNLIQNALDAVAGRGDPRITITATRNDTGGLIVRIADNGSGIADSLADTLFTPFATAKPQGLGLGLAIARDIAREFGGDLAATAAEGEGATFLLTLQLA